MSATVTLSADPHSFESVATDASRSPCPALNACAAHGYLPRSGRDITFLQLLKAIRMVYNTSLPLSLFLTFAGFLLCGPNGRPAIPFLQTIDLHDLARHGRIEHDASLAHGDAEPGAVFAPTTPDEAVLGELLREAKGRKNLNLADFARIRAKRDEEARIAGAGLDFVHADITRGECALTLGILGNGEEVPVERVRQWMGEDRLPDGWTRPEKSLGFLDLMSMTRKVRAAVKAERTNIVAREKVK